MHSQLFFFLKNPEKDIFAISLFEIFKKINDIHVFFDCLGFEHKYFICIKWTDEYYIHKYTGHKKQKKKHRIVFHFFLPRTSIGETFANKAKFAPICDLLNDDF